MSEQGHIYFFKVKDMDYYKIGYTKHDVITRLHTVRVGCPFVLYPVSAYLVEDAYNVEQHLHNAFAKNRMEGEWFNIAQYYASDIGKALKKISKDCSCSPFCRDEYYPRYVEGKQEDVIRDFGYLRKLYV